MFSSRGLHSSQNCAHNCTANAHKCNHHDEPADADRLTDGDATARLEVSPRVVRPAGLLLLQVGVVVSSRAAGRVVGLAGPENKNRFNSRKLSVVAAVAWPGPGRTRVMQTIDELDLQTDITINTASNQPAGPHLLPSGC